MIGNNSINTDPREEDRQPQILVVDDEEPLGRALEKILQNEGYTVDYVTTGQGALDYLGRKPYDLLVSDLKLPDIDGMEVVRQAKGINPELQVLIITGYGSVPSAVRAMKLGAFDYLSKPFTKNEFVDMVQGALKQINGPVLRDSVEKKETYTFSHNGKVYEVDSRNFLTNFNDWDENFTEGLALQLDILPELTKEHWDIIKTIRKYFKEEGICPNVYETCRVCGLHITEMGKLFPTGYWRGACKLAGVNSWGGPLGQVLPYNKTYELDVRGFLVNPDDWDEYFAVFKASELKIREGKLSDRHWELIKFLRKSYKQNNEVPTIFETCKANQIDLKDLELLFPDGYHRGAVKLAGLRVGGPPMSKNIKVD